MGYYAALLVQHHFQYFFFIGSVILGYPLYLIHCDIYRQNVPVTCIQHFSDSKYHTARIKVKIRVNYGYFAFVCGYLLIPWTLCGVIALIGHPAAALIVLTVKIGIETRSILYK